MIVFGFSPVRKFFFFFSFFFFTGVEVKKQNETNPPPPPKKNKKTPKVYRMVFLVFPVFQIRDGSRVKNPTATATWPDSDRNENRLKYCYKPGRPTLCDPLKNCMTPCQKKLTWTLLPLHIFASSSITRFIQTMKFLVSNEGNVLLCINSWIFLYRKWNHSSSSRQLN